MREGEAISPYARVCRRARGRGDVVRETMDRGREGREEKERREERREKREIVRREN